MATIKTTSNVTLVIETNSPYTKTLERRIESVVRTALDNYAAVTSQDEDSKPWNDVIEMIRENIEVKIIWKDY